MIVCLYCGKEIIPGQPWCRGKSWSMFHVACWKRLGKYWKGRLDSGVHHRKRGKAVL